MCCSVFNNLLPQTSVCCHGNDSRTNTGLGLSGRRREIMNKQLRSIISESTKKPQNHEFRWERLSPCLNTSMRVLLLQNGIPTAHKALGLSGSCLGTQFTLLLFLFFPSSPLHRSGFSRDREVPNTCPSHRPHSPGMLMLGDAAWVPELRREQGTSPAHPDHSVQARSFSSLQQIKAFKSIFKKNRKSFPL